MPYTLSQDNSAASVLQMNSIMFDEVIFKRTGIRDEKRQNNDVQLSIKVDIYKSEEKDTHRVVLQVIASKEKEYHVKVTVSGYFSVDPSCEYAEEIMKKNAVAILFPFVRSELTIITSQPEVEPLVLPVFNINGLVNNLSKEDLTQ